MLSTSEIAWGAGLLEGEGCFMASKNSSPRKNGTFGSGCLISLAMTDEDVVTRFRDLFMKSNRIHRFHRPGPKQTHKPVFSLCARGVRAAGLMMTFYSFLGVRRRAKIREVLAAWQATPARIKKRWQV